MIEMTIADGLTELKLINERYTKQIAEITKYSSRNKLMPEEMADQKKYLRELIQSTNDQLRRYVKIKMAIQQANLTATITFNDRVFSIAEAILYKQGLIDKMTTIWNSLSDKTAVDDLARIRGFNGVSTTNEKSMAVLDTMGVIERFYDAKERDNELTKLLELRSYLDRLIEKANHQTIITVD